MTSPSVSLLLPSAVATRLGVSVDQLEHWRRHGQGPAWVQLSSGSIRYDETDVVDYEVATGRQLAAIAYAQLSQTPVNGSAMKQDGHGSPKRPSRPPAPGSEPNSR